MFTCGDCVDDDCEGRQNPNGNACDEFTQEVWDAVPDVPGLELKAMKWDEDRIAELEDQVAELNDKMIGLENIFAAIHKVYMGSEL
jgi:hypothetical protein